MSETGTTTGVACEDVFARLGAEIEDAWRNLGRREAAFPEIATVALGHSALTEHVTGLDVLRWVLRQAHIAPSPSDDFAQPAVTVFRGERFLVEVLYWVDGTTAIHQHAFCGAFHVLQGSSVHVQYGFEPHEVVNSRLTLGAVRYRSSELLARGDTRAILPGAALIHSLFHLDRPSVTVVVRNYAANSPSPPYAYRKPALAYDPFGVEPLFAKKLDLLQMLAQTNVPAYVSQVREVLPRVDFESCVAVLGQAHARLNDADALAGLLAAARRAHGRGVDALPAVFEEDRRQRAVVELRKRVRDPDARFFLAVLLNAPNREACLGLVRSRYAGDPVARVLRWIDEHGELAPDGALAGPLGLDAWTRGAVSLMLEGHPPDAVLEQLRRLDASADRVALADLRDALARSLLAPLFVEQA